MTSPSLAARIAIRSGLHRGPTPGLAPGYVQGNLAVLPAAMAADFLRFCQRNPKPCPLIGMGETGVPAVPALGVDLDIRTDIPGYCLFRDGELVVVVVAAGKRERNAVYKTAGAR